MPLPPGLSRLPVVGAAPVSELVQRVLRSWQRSDALFGLLADESVLLVRPIALRHPFVFYLGHLAAFAWNQAGAGVLGEAPIDPAFDQLFERGIDPLSADAAANATISSWPGLDEVRDYRDAVRSALLRVAPALEASEDPLARRILHVVLEHEQMHHETLMYILQRLDFDRKVGAGAVPAGLLDAGGVLAVPVARSGAGDDPRRVAIGAGRVRLGADFDEQPFGWCNEFPSSWKRVPAFSLDELPVTVARFARFVEAGGYSRRELWDAGAWAWKEGQGLELPIDWSPQGLRTMFGFVDFDAAGALPVHVSRAEARAFCRWAGGRLPSEAELQHSAYGGPGGSERSQPWGERAPAARFGNFGWRHLGALPVGSHPEGASAWGVQELVGNGWEWTDTPFRPLPGFEPWIRTYPGYSADFFDDRHFVVFGASWATADGLVRRSLRNWYQGHYPHVFSTFRCAWSD